MSAGLLLPITAYDLSVAMCAKSLNVCAMMCLSGPRGFFCPGDSNVQPVVCSPGFFCPNASMDLAIPCRKGGFCPLPGMSSVEPCPFGEAAPAGSQSCTRCPFGASLDQSFCLSSNYTCRAGYGKTNHGCVPCSTGFFSEGDSECLRCAEATYANANASDHCLLCSSDPGVWCSTELQHRGVASGRFHCQWMLLARYTPCRATTLTCAWEVLQSLA